jgi:hypothetical protein
LALGYWSPTHKYLSPEHGVGYVLGIVGGGAMLVLLLYPLRKRWSWLGFMGSTKRWFQAHMILGVVGPLLVLYHSNFSLGAANSNVALICMLIVSGSGLFGRYFYSRIHHGLYGSKATLAELQAQAQRIRAAGNAVAFLPDLTERVAASEALIVKRGEGTAVLLRPFAAGWATLRARWQLHLHVRRALRTSTLPRDQQERLYRTASMYVDARLQTTRRVIEFDAYDRLFSLWHVLHLPLFFMLVIAGVVHVIAVHVY